MSLLGTLQVANNSLIATQVGLQIVGNNISNANTEGYSRQHVVYSPAPTQLVGPLAIGLGVQIQGILQQSDRFLNERLRGAISDVENTDVQKQTYLQLESIIGELSKTDLGSTLNQFFASINDVLNQPEDSAVRNLTVLQGQTLAQDIQRLDSRVRQLRKGVNDSIVSMAAEINRLTAAIADLNVEIVAIEGTASTTSEAGGLRDQRNLALADLAKIIGIRTTVQPSGSVSVFVGGDYLVTEGVSRRVDVAVSDEQNQQLPFATINIVDSDSPVESSAGKLGGLYEARDNILGGFLNGLNDFSRHLMFEFNKVHSSGQGLTGFASLVSEFSVADTDAALDQAGLEFTPVNGSFQVMIRNKFTGVTTTSDIRVDLNGLDDDTSLDDLVQQLDGIEGLSAQTDTLGRVRLSADSSVLEFGFTEDTSGVLAALGINTFFTGSSSADIGVSSVVATDPGKLATSQTGIGVDTANGEALAGLSTAPLEALENRTLIEQYERFVGVTFQASASTQAIHEGFQTFQKTLEGQQLGISGVNIDEEAVMMMQYQRVYQASTRLILAINELLEVLVNL